MHKMKPKVKIFDTLKRISVLLLALTMSFTAHASFQQGILIYKGTVTDSNSAPVEYATVAIVNAQGAVLAGTAANEDGSYVMKAVKSVDSVDDLRLVCSFVGYKEFNSNLKDCIVEVQGDTLKIRTIVLEEDAQALATAVVSGKRELIEHHFDKIVLNVSELAAAKTGNALDVLKNSPGVTVDKDGNVQLNGQTVAVWIDGRPSNLSGKDLEVFLKGNPGTTIEKVELMSSPSAKYDAEGSGGIINLKTRKGFMQGLSGSISATGAFKLKPLHTDINNGMAFDGTANLVYKSDKTYTMFSYSPSYLKQSAMARENKWYGADYSDLQESETYMDVAQTGHNVKIQNDWHITGDDVFGVIANVTTSNSPSNSRDGSIINNYKNWGTAQQTLYSGMRSATGTLGSGTFVYANLNYTHDFDKSRAASITLNADYSINNSKEDNTQKNKWEIIPSVEDYPQVDLSAYKDYGFLENTDRTLHLASLKSDYTTIFWKQTGRIEAGFKGAMSLTNNNFNRYDYNVASNPWELASAPGTQDHFKYREWIGAAYVNVAKQFNAKWNAQAGLRGEMTFTQGLWQSAPRTSDKYFDIFPNATVTFMPSPKYIFSVNYAYRISRPKYWQLNPFKSYVNATTYVHGKVDLKPEYSHNVSLTAILFGRLSISGGYAKTLNYNELQVPKFDTATGSIGLVFDNSGTQDIAYAQLSLSEQPITKWWNVTLSASYRYNSFKAYPELQTGLQSGYTNNGGMFMGYAATTFFLPLNFKTGLSGYYCTSQTVGFYKADRLWTVNFFLNKTFLDGKLSLDFAVDDIFSSLNQNLKIYDQGHLSYSIYQINTMTSFKLGVSWRFGKSTAAARRNVGKLDESSRM